MNKFLVGLLYIVIISLGACKTSDEDIFDQPTDVAENELSEPKPARKVAVVIDDTELAQAPNEVEDQLGLVASPHVPVPIPVPIGDDYESDEEDGGDCDTDADCDDDNDCTDDNCVNGECDSEDNTDECDDDNDCTTDDTCTDGECVGEAPESKENTNTLCSDGIDNDCDDLIDCLDDECKNKNCVDDDPCSENTVCTSDNQCEGSQISLVRGQTTYTYCAAISPCKYALCTDQDCAPPENLAVDTACNDNDACTSPDECGMTGVCTGADVCP